MDNEAKRQLVQISYVIPEGDDYAGQVEVLWAYSLATIFTNYKIFPFMPNT
jgi:hypothetical protein